MTGSDTARVLTPPTRVALVSVGNELLFGETVDTNSAWLGRRLTSWGLRVVAGFTVRDRVDEIQEAVRRAAAAADLVIVSGGLGPTSDDLTKGAVADLIGVGLVMDPDVRAAVRERFRASGREMPELSEGQAEIPEGARALPNDVGTAPGILLEWGRATLLLVPGVPREMRSIVEGPFRTVLQEAGSLAAGLHHLVIHTTGIPESRLAELVQPAWDALPDRLRADVGLAFLPDELGVDLRLSLGRVANEDPEARLDELRKALAPVVQPWRFEAAGGDLAEAVSDELRRLGWTLAAAESCTGGLVAQRITEHAGASDVFVGAVVAYANGVKLGQLGVSPDDLERHGAVSEAVARQMATGVAERLGADVGVSITGVAGPGGGSAEKPVGTVWIAVAARGAVTADLERFAGDRGAVRRRSAQSALDKVYRRLAGIDAGV